MARLAGAEGGVTDRRGQVWEDPRGELHLIVEEGWPGSLGGFFHATLRLMTGVRANLTDLPDRKLEDRREWRRIA